MVKTLKKRKYNKRNKIGKGLFKLFTRRNNDEIEISEPINEEFNKLLKPIKDVKNIYEEHSNNIEKLYHDCRNICKSYDCLGNETMCDQLNNMIYTKTPYEWGYFCANTLNKQECKDFLKYYKILELYTNSLIELGEKAKEVKNLLNKYKISEEKTKEKVENYNMELEDKNFKLKN